ncbi:MAG: class I SAM-dependent RNA methyltransferase [Alphaproteobacteria bacterium]|nr:class I SAM-dependent RNA methyltransferase [Alphaproteobacteria bacterium]
MSGRAEIVRLAARGDGGTADGRFVPMAAPGDILEADGSVTPGPHRAIPPCRHFPECGGCQLQHVDDAAYRQWIGQRILDALRPVGLAPAELMPAHLSPPRSRRRASLRAARRGKRAEIGFNQDSSHRIVDMADCHILAPELVALVAPLRALLAEALVDGQGGGATMTLTETGVDLLLSNVAAERLEQIERLTGFAEAQDLARLAIEGAGGVDIIAERRAPLVRFGGVAVQPPPAPFLQATADGEAALQAAVAAVVGESERIGDLFCGLGTFALPLSAQAKVQALDAAGPAVAALLAAARGAGRPVLSQHRDLFRQPLTGAELQRLDAVVIDPPRAGAVEQTKAIAAAGVPVVAAVSCNPNTFARDAAILGGAGYRLGRLWPVGQFRWSTHVELVAEFRR